MNTAATPIPTPNAKPRVPGMKNGFFQKGTFFTSSSGNFLSSTMLVDSAGRAWDVMIESLSSLVDSRSLCGAEELLLLHQT
ncbi:hypothetical protein JCM24511_05608 [Saitozyma sp. JCM 24511]|nr:hypothetical protein JCM24511_05608 [Saitozyma sp. JCM 24511]